MTRSGQARVIVEAFVAALYDYHALYKLYQWNCLRQKRIDRGQRWGKEIRLKIAKHSLLSKLRIQNANNELCEVRWQSS